MSAILKKTAGFALLAAGLLLLFSFYRCPFSWIFGIPCPGCGMRSALLALKEGNWRLSLWYHALLLPTILCAFLCLFLKKEKRQRLLLIWGIAMLGYYVIRMAVYQLNPPMEINEQALLIRLLRIWR